MFLDDAPVALFILEEEARDRDPAATLADGVLAARDRALRPPMANLSSRKRPGRRRDPLHAMMHRGTARLRHDIQVEDAIRRAAVRAADPPRTTAEAARYALALKQASATVRPLRAPHADPVGHPLKATPEPAADAPRRAQPP
jgi:hypothetical protein